MVLLVTILLVTGVAILIGYPLLREEARPRPAGGGPLAELEAKKERTYSALKEIEFDFRTGKLSEEDYRELEEQYRVQALQLLREIDRAAAGGNGKGEAQAAERPARAESAFGGAALACWNCGVTVRAGDRFCEGCGNPLDRICPKCGDRYEKGDRFCGACGEPVVDLSPLLEGSG